VNSEELHCIVVWREERALVTFISVCLKVEW